MINIKTSNILHDISVGIIKKQQNIDEKIIAKTYKIFMLWISSKTALFYFIIYTQSITLNAIRRLTNNAPKNKNNIKFL